MKTREIQKKINELLLNADNEKNECRTRENAQLLFLLIHEDCSVSESEKENRLNGLRKAVRPLLRSDYENDTDICEINSLVSELCLAASFYLLEKEKRIRLYEALEDTFVKISKRAFENCFYRIISKLFSKNDEISVEIKASGCRCTVLISAEIPEKELCENLPGNALAVYENSLFSLALKTEKAETIPEKTSGEDFSLLLSDSLSPLQIWLCDI